MWTLAARSPSPQNSLSLLASLSYALSPNLLLLLVQLKHQQWQEHLCKRSRYLRGKVLSGFRLVGTKVGYEKHLSKGLGSFLTHLPFPCHSYKNPRRERLLQVEL